MKRETWGELMLFAAVAEARSFTAAARGLGLSPSALSHAIRGLEARLGVRLLNRTTRSVAPTAAGERMLAALRPAIDGVADALGALEAERDRPAGRVRVSAHRTAALHVVLPKLPALARRHPEVAVELVVQDGLVDVVRDGFDAGVRVEEVLERDMVSVRIAAPMRVVVVASPDYLARAGTPRAPADLLGHRLLAYRYTSSGLIHRWRFARGGETAAIDPEPAFTSNDVDVLLEAAVAGLGVTTASEPQARAHLTAGRLVSLMEDWCPDVPANHLYYPGRRQVGAALRAFVDAMRA